MSRPRFTPVLLLPLLGCLLPACCSSPLEGTWIREIDGDEMTRVGVEPKPASATRVVDDVAPDGAMTWLGGPAIGLIDAGGEQRWQIANEHGARTAFDRHGDVLVAYWESGRLVVAAHSQLDGEVMWERSIGEASVDLTIVGVDTDDEALIVLSTLPQSNVPRYWLARFEPEE